MTRRCVGFPVGTPCENPPGTRWSPHWCPECNTARMEHISVRLEGFTTESFYCAGCGVEIRGENREGHAEWHAARLRTLNKSFNDKRRTAGAMCGGNAGAVESGEAPIPAGSRCVPPAR